jgi:DNA-binding MarR family transcriptional regulator
MPDQPHTPPEQPDGMIHQPVRLKIMAALNALPSSTGDESWLEFTRLKAITGATEGNLGAHITALENAAYIEVTKDFAGKRPRTRTRMTKSGRRAFEDYKDFLRSVIG